MVCIPLCPKSTGYMGQYHKKQNFSTFIYSPVPVRGSCTLYRLDIDGLYYVLVPGETENIKRALKERQQFIFDKNSS